MSHEEEMILRKLLWLRHDPAHYSALYGDDGEMQCGACIIDFKRDLPSHIEEIWNKRHLLLMEKLPKCPHGNPSIKNVKLCGECDV